MKNKKIWLIVTAWGLGMAIVNTEQSVSMAAESGRVISWWSAMPMHLASVALWIPMTMAMLLIVRRFPLERGVWPRSLLVLAGALLAVIVVRAVYVYFVNPLVHWYAVTPSLPEVLVASVRNNLVLGTLIIGIAHAFHFFERNQAARLRIADLESGLARAQLDALRSQLNPHFLFNVLNSIAELLHHDSAAADRMLVGLSTLLRRSLDSNAAQEITVREELELLEHYIAIEKVRMGTRLTVTLNVEAVSLDAYMPALLLQPLVENAVVHAIAKRAQPGEVRIEISRRDESLFVSVDDDGAPTPSERAGHGIGLANTEARLRCLYGPAYRLTLTNNQRGGKHVVVTMPLRWRRDAAQQPDTMPDATKAAR
jgi:LytS/YehU family sensor histidine kinase